MILSDFREVSEKGMIWKIVIDRLTMKEPLYGDLFLTNLE